MLAVDAQEILPVQAARAGEAVAWDTLFRRYQLPLYVYVFELVHDEQVALDVVQETFINAARHLGSLREDERFGSWLFSIAHQKCVQHWRRVARSRDAFASRVEECLAEIPDSAESPLDGLIRVEQEEKLLAAIACLPLPQRSVVLLHFLEGFSLDEIGRITDTPVGTVKSRLHYAKAALRQTLERDTL